MTYDLNGNIKTLNRFTKGTNTPLLIDNLTYSYENGNNSNRLHIITDATTNTSGYEGGGVPNLYDLNGNMTAMPDKGISAIAYNFLNLPTQINQNSNTTKYIYRADGVKVKKAYTLVNASGTKLINTEYLDGFQYSTPNIKPIRKALEEQDDATVSASTAGEVEAFSPLEDRALAVIGPDNPPQAENMILSFFPTAEGYYDFENFRYIYQYKDQVGNVRVSYTKDPVTQLAKSLDQNDYYPFGMSHLKETPALYDPISIPYNYKFQEQELQETGFYSFKWRQYMPDVGRFFNADPLSEKYAYQSHYNFSENRVVDGREIEGLEVDIINEDGSHDVDYSMDNWGGLAYNEVSLDKCTNEFLIDEVLIEADFWDKIFDFFGGFSGDPESDFIDTDTDETFYNFYTEGLGRDYEGMGEDLLREGDRVEWINFDDFVKPYQGPHATKAARTREVLAESLKNAVDAKEKLENGGKPNDTTFIIDYNAEYRVGEHGIILQDAVIEVTVEKNEDNRYRYDNNSAIRDAIDAEQQRTLNQNRR